MNRGKKRRRFSGFVMKREQFQQAFSDSNVETISVQRSARSRRMRRVCLTLYNCITKASIRTALIVAFALLLFLFFARAFLAKTPTQHRPLPAEIEPVQLPEVVLDRSDAEVEAEVSVEPPREKPLEIMVLGMHHSATSLVTKMMSLLGVYMGEPEDLLMLKGNSLNYFELKAAVDANKRVISKGWMNKGPWWYGYGFLRERVVESEMVRFTAAVKGIIQKMRRQAQGRSWLVKDPRLCLLAEDYLKEMENPVCVIVWRDVLEVSRRLLGYNTISMRLSLAEIAETWKHSMRESIRACRAAAAPILYIRYEDFIERPLKVAHEVGNQLRSLGFETVVASRELSSLFGEKFVNRHSTKKALSMDSEQLLSRLKYLVDNSTWRIQAHLASEGRLELDSETLNNASWSWSRQREKKIKSKEAYFTFVTADNPGYVAGAEVLAASIRTFDSSRDLVAMVSEEVTSRATLRGIKAGGWRIARVPKLEEPWYNVHPRCKRFNQAQAVRWGRMYSKLNLWSRKYEKVVYLDTDTLVLRSLEEYFKLPLPFYGERSPSHNGINAGILVIEPSTQILEQMLEFARTNEPLQFFRRNQVGCTEQELLNRFWHGEQMSVKLNDTRHADFLSKRFTQPIGRDILLKKGSAVVHWLTTKCPKPWDIEASKLGSITKSERGERQRSIPSYCDPRMYKLWHSYYWAVKPVSGFDKNSAVPLPAGLRQGT